MHFDDIKRKAQDLFKKRGGDDGFRGATDEGRNIPPAEDSITEKAEDAAAALRNPGPVGPDPRP